MNLYFVSKTRILKLPLVQGLCSKTIGLWIQKIRSTIFFHSYTNHFSKLTFVYVYFRLFMKLRASQSYRMVSKLCWQWNKFGVFQQYLSLYTKNTCKDSNSISVSTVFEFTGQHQDDIYREIVCVRKKAIVWLIYEHKIGEY